MKKTFTINISGIVFNIDEDAYEKLSAYLKKIKKHFQGSEGGDEIINDIESRIAEILQEKMSDTKQVVSIDDIDEIIEIMGQPSEFTEEESGSEESSDTYQPSSPYKRLYRDVDNRMLGGVSAGIAAYLRIDPVWIRLIFILLTLFSGVGILIYIIMWIVVPEARTTAEKLEMKGRKVNISNIEQSIQEEVNNLKDKINDLTDEAKKTFKKKSSDLKPAKDPVPGIIESVFRVLGRVLLILAGIVVFLLGLSFLVLLIGTMTGAGSFYVFEELYFTPFPETGLLSLLVESPSNIPVIKTTIALVVGVPILMLLIVGATWMFGLNRSRYIGVAALNVWIISFIVLVIMAFSVARDFRYENDHTRETLINSSIDKTLTIKQTSDDFDRYEYRIITGNEWIIAEDNMYFHALGKPSLSFKVSEDTLCRLVLLSQARGRSEEKALERAQNIIYNFNQSDTLLLLDDHFLLKSGEVWRDQELNLKLCLPEGKKIFIGERMSDILKFNSKYSRHYMEGREFVMTGDGLEPVIPETTALPATQGSPRPVVKVFMALFSAMRPNF